jgi:hypothetical protein
MPLRNEDAAALARPVSIKIEPVQSQSVSARGLSAGMAFHGEIPPQALFDNQPVRRGVITGFTKVCERWQLSNAKQIALLGYAGDEFVGAQILSGRTRGGQDVRDRVGLLVAIAVGLRALFNNNVGSETRWLQICRSETDGKSAIDYMAEGHMINLIRVREIVDRERAL